MISKKMVKSEKNRRRNKTMTPKLSPINQRETRRRKKKNKKRVQTVRKRANQKKKRKGEKAKTKNDVSSNNRNINLFYNRQS